MVEVEILKAFEWWKTVANNVGSITISREEMLAVLNFVNSQNEEIKRLSTLAELGNMRANDYRVMRDRALKAEEEVKQLKKEIEHNYEIRRKANGLVKSIEEKLPMCYEEHRVMGINQMFEKAEGMSEVVFGDVAVRLSDLKIIQEEMVADAKIATTTETEGE